MLTITPVDEVYVRIDCEDDIAKELSEYFQFEVPGARFMQSKFGKHWSGKIKLFKLNTHKIYRGLVPRIIEFANARDYEVVNHVPAPDPLWKEHDELVEYVQGLRAPHTPRDYQWAALRALLNNERGIILSPTGSGKSFIIYLLARALGEKTLVIVPTLGLVSQMVNDFKSYGYTDPITTIQGGKSKTTATELTVSTWQSIYELPEAYFNQFGCVVVDEVHTAKSKSLSGLMERCTQVGYRFGFTGTIDNTECHRLVLEGLFGSVIRVATTAQLVKKNQLAPLRVRMCVLSYPETIRKHLRYKSYQEEVDWLIQEHARNEFIARMVANLKGNTLVLFQFVDKHGLGLFKRIKEVCTDKPVYYIAGDVEADDREAIRAAINAGTDSVLVASYGTTQLGTNIPRLDNLVLAHPAKSEIRVLQSIGRILRLAEGKICATLIDIADDLRVKKYVNHCFKHAQARVEYYSTEKFKTSMVQIDLGAFSQMLHKARQAGSGATNADGNDSEHGERSDGL